MGSHLILVKIGHYSVLSQKQNIYVKYRPNQKRSAK